MGFPKSMSINKVSQNGMAHTEITVLSISQKDGSFPVLPFDRSLVQQQVALQQLKGHGRTLMSNAFLSQRDVIHPTMCITPMWACNMLECMLKKASWNNFKLPSVLAVVNVTTHSICSVKYHTQPITTLAEKWAHTSCIFAKGCPKTVYCSTLNNSSPFLSNSERVVGTIEESPPDWEMKSERMFHCLLGEVWTNQADAMLIGSM
jgi:hypothetical protein